MLYAEKLAREEGLPGFEESSDGESDPDEDQQYNHRTKRLTTTTANHGRLNNCCSSCLQQTKQFISQDNQIGEQLQQQEAAANEQLAQQQAMAAVMDEAQEGVFKWNIGVKLFNAWLQPKVEAMNATSRTHRVSYDLTKLRNEELNALLAEFIREV